jgi:integrase
VSSQTPEPITPNSKEIALLRELVYRFAGVGPEEGTDMSLFEAAEAAADATGDEDFRKVSSHDLRRRFAQRLLIDEELNPRVVMQVGGWDSFQAIEPYLNAPTPEVVDAAFEGAELV